MLSYDVEEGSDRLEMHSYLSGEWVCSGRIILLERHQTYWCNSKHNSRL